MNVLVDTNILISVVFVPQGQVASIINSAYNHKFIICKYVFDEFVGVVNRKRPSFLPTALKMITSDTFEYMNPDISGVNVDVSIRDRKDLPVIQSAIALDCDILLSGDKDLTSVSMERPMILSPREFDELFISQGAPA